MPEGHTTHRIARDIRKDLSEQVIEASSPQGRVTDLAAVVDGSVLTKAEAYGKHLAFHCTGDNHTGDNNQQNVSIIHVHLGLIGKFTRAPADTPTRDTIRLRLRAGSSPLGPVWDLTGPNTCELINEGEWDHVTSRLGPDPLRAGAGLNGKACAQFCNTLARRKVPLATALLDQTIVAGIGNVFRSELSFLIGVDPRKQASSLSESQTKELWATIVGQLRRGVRLNRIVTITEKDAQDLTGSTPGRLGRDESLYVYKRQGEPCRRCGTAIKFDELANRRIWWCPRCQS